MRAGSRSPRSTRPITYAPPAERQAQLWAQRTPEGFKFDVKAYSLNATQHPTRPQSLWKDLREQLSVDVLQKRNLYAKDLAPDMLEEAWRRFDAALHRLHEAGRLGAVLFRYPPWFTPRRDNRQEIGALRGLPAYRGCSRSPTPTCWSCASTAGRTRPGRAALVRRPSVFRYLYSEGELRELAQPIRELAAEVQESHLLMNNCYRDYGVRNAVQLRDLLSSRVA